MGTAKTGLTGANLPQNSRQAIAKYLTLAFLGMRNRINMLVMGAGAALALGAIGYWTVLDVQSPRDPNPATGQVFRISTGKQGRRYVTADERRNYYISWGALLVGVIVVTAIQKGAWDFPGRVMMTEKHISRPRDPLALANLSALDLKPTHRADRPGIGN
ncbi:MAG: hypothetical protein JWM91_2049 [Rhodospirillales bacterium]|nr:hypothetical protein [Rhodospirillales bacterium]